MSKGKRGAPRGNNRVGAAMADRKRADCRVTHLGHEPGNSRSTNSQNAKGCRPLMGNGPSRSGGASAGVAIPEDTRRRAASSARNLRCALRRDAPNHYFTQFEIYLSAFYNWCRLTVDPNAANPPVHAGGLLVGTTPAPWSKARAAVPEASAVLRPIRFTLRANERAPDHAGALDLRN